MNRTKGIRIFDGHNDTILRLYQSEDNGAESFFTRGQVGHIDLPRAIEGGLGGGFFAMFVPAKKDQTISAKARTDQQIKTSDWDVSNYVPTAYAQEKIGDLISVFSKLERVGAGKFTIVRDIKELNDCWRSDSLAAVMHIEGAEAIEADLSNLKKYYKAGLRSLGIVWSRSNAFGHGVPFIYPSSPDTGDGLTEAGRDLVKACNQLGIMVDLSHINEKGFWDVTSISDAPLVATHSGVHALCPASRNLTDEQLEAIAASNGVVGINFHVGFLRPDGKTDPETPLSDIVSHVDYAVKKIGIEHVAFGSDFDGATMPNSLQDVAGFPKVIQALAETGYSEEDIKLIAHHNWLRVLEETWH